MVKADKCSEAAIFFRNEPGFARLLAVLIKRYGSLGRIGGSVKLESLSKQEADSLSTFFRCNYVEQQLVIISFIDFIRAFEQTRFSDIEIMDFFSAYQGTRLLTNEEILRQKQLKKEKLFATIGKEYPHSICQKWLIAISEKRPGTRRVHLAYEQNVTILCRNVKVVLQALSSLPEKCERLPLFAQRISGDPHALDRDTEAGRLFLDALGILKQERNDEIELDVVMAQELVTLRSLVEEENELLYEFRLLRDDVLNFVTCSGMAAAWEEGGSRQEMMYWRQAWQEKAVMNIPLREILKVEYLYPAEVMANGKKDVFVVENSSVFSSLVDVFIQGNLPLPPLFCMHGQFKLASWVAIDRLVAGGCIIWYSGDFDPEGLFIAARLLARYPGSVKLWRYSVEDYMNSLSDVSLEAERLNKLQAVRCPEFATLVQKINEVKRAGYQEGLTKKLARDIGSGFALLR